ncbi:DUF11 domain-containing protein, partial [Arthrospiribacter ruber]|nr:DUF11 domain-containing protein [Arthrospiribacter ruber]
MRYFVPPIKIFVLLFIFMCFLNERTYSQSKILANEITVSSNFSHSGNNASNALNDDPGSFARSVSSPGLLIGAGAVTGVLELQFPETRPAGSVSYIQIDGDENLFNALLGGSLGDALSGVLGAIILGNQVITVEARNNTTTVLSRNSNQGFSIDAVRLVQDKDGNFYLALRPGSDYNRIRITNEATSLVGLFAGYTLDVYNAFHLADEDTCGSPLFTSFDGSGLNLDLLDIGNVGVNDLENAIDGDIDTYSTISPGLLSLGGSLSQFFDFGSPSIENDEIQITLSGTEGVLDLTLLGSIQFRAYNGTDLIYDENLAALNTEILGLLQIDLLGLLADGNVVTIPIQPGGVFDRFEIIVNGVLSVGTNESLRIHEVFQTPGRPTYENPEDANLVVCATDDVTISVVSQADETVHWYAQPIGGEILETGNTFNIGNVSQRSVYYAGTSRDGCPVESSRVPVTIEVDNNPQIAILGSQVFTLPVGESLQLPEAVAFNEDETEVDTEITPLDGAPFQGGGIAGPFNSPGVYVYRVSATGDNCTNFLDITVNVQDFEDCPLVLSPGFANDGTEFTTSSLLGIQLGTVTNPNNAADGDLSTFSLLEETVGTTLLGLTGETAQFLKWNIQQPAGNTVTVKLGREYAGTAQLAAGIYIQPFDNGQPVGNRTFADVNLVSVLNGLNEFNFTFVPTDFSGQPVSFDAVKVSLVPILNFDQVVRVYGAYTNIASVDASVCEPVVRELQTGFVSLIGALDVATSLTGVFNPERAVDGDLTTFASITNAVGVNVYSKLEVAYNYPILVGDSLKVTIGIPTGLLDLSLLEGLIIQRFLGNEAVGEPIDASSSLLSLRLLTGNSTGELSFVSEVPFDRIRVLYGGLASVLEEVRIFEIEAIPNVSIEGEFFDEEDGIWKLEICEGETIELDEDDCGEIRLFTEAEGGDEIDLASISALERGETLNVYIQVDRFGCELDSHRRLLEITITGSAPPAGDAEQSFCESDNPTIADLIIAGENIQWYNLEEGGEALEAGTPLVSGETYYASQTEEGECESIERFAVLVEVLTTPAPTAPALIQEFCSSDNATLAQIAIEGENIQWYASESDQTPLSINTLLEDGVTYFASQTDPENGCESLERIGITITLLDCELDLATLAITKTAGSATVVAGTELNYTITVSNTGTATATGVTVSDELPEFTEFVSTDNGGELTGNTVNWDLGDLGAGESVTINLVLFVPADVEAGTMIRNVAVADSPDDPDGPVDNDPDPEDDVEVVTEADLSVMKSADVSLVQAGSNLRYVISVTNNGPSDAQEVIVSDVLPAGTTFVSADNGGTEDGGTVSWSLGTMTPGQSIELELIVAVGEDLEDGTVIRNIAVVDSPTDPDGPKESDPEDVTVENDARAKLEIEKTAGSATVVAGTELSYTITVSNTGTATATGVTVSDELPEFTEFVSTDNGGELTGNTVNWDLGDLGAGESVTINLVLFVPADVEAGTMIRNVAVADSPDDPDGPVDNDPDPEDDVEVVTEADLSVIKSADVSLVQAGSNLRYVISVTNNGPSDAQDVSVSDVLPAGTTFVSADNGGTEDGGTVSWSLDTMTPGQSIELELIVSVGEDLEDGTVIRNIAVVDSPTDPDGPKESDPEDVTVENDARAKLEIEKTAGSATVVAGTELSYTITVSNTGTATATGVTVSDELPEFTEFVSTDNGGELTGNTVNWDLGDLGAGESVTINLVLFVPADVEAGTMIRNVAVADSPDDPDGPVDNDPDPEDDVEVVTEADLSV